MTFSLNDVQQQQFQEWDTEHRKTCRMKGYGSIGGRLSFVFTPTSVGCVVMVECSCGAKIDLSDYENW